MVSSKSVKRVAFVWPDLGWMGGVNYFRSLFQAIHQYGDGQVVPVLFTGKRSDTYGLEAYAEVVRTSLLDERSPAWLISKFIKAVLNGRELLLRRLLNDHQIDVISHFNWLWAGCGIPAISWIPDFQVIYLPDNYTEKERKRTLLSMKQACEKSDVMVLSSEHAQHDFERFFTKASCKGEQPPGFVLRFPASFSGSPDELPSADELRKKYDLPDEPWFHVPNQFWRHKNHQVIAHALSLLQEKDAVPLVIATGKTEDSRDKAYFPAFAQAVQDAGLEERLRMPGQIPYQDMMAFMLHAVAVINPSSFEGWSTTVEEAKLFGKKLLLSDIEVHREQAPDRGAFFKLDDAPALASLLEGSLKQFKPEEERVFTARAFAHQDQQIQAFCQDYIAIIDHITQGSE